MDKVYERINWQNEPSVATPINATNLNKIDYALDALDDRVIELNKNQSDANEQINEKMDGMQRAITKTEETLNTKAQGIICNASGNPAVLPASSGNGFIDIVVNGASVQDDTPTVAAPQAFINVATGGSLEIKASSKNLVDIPNGTYQVSASFDCNLEAGKYIYSREAYESTYAGIGSPYAIRIYYEFEGEIMMGGEVLLQEDANNVLFEAFGPVVKIEILAGETPEKSAGHSFTITNAMIRREGTNDVYVPYQGSNSIEIPLAQPLRKCDKIIKQNGVWGVLRSTKVVPFGGTWRARTEFAPPDGSACYSSADFITDNMKSTEYMYMACTHLTFGGGVVGGADIKTTGRKGCFYKISIYVSTGGTTTYVCSDAPTLADFLAEMEGAIFEYELAEPVFEPFPADVQEAIAGLHGYKPATYITTDSEVEHTIDVEYMADTKAYIDDKILELVKN